MDLAKVSSKGQITIPIDIRKKLRLREGDKVLFVEQEEGVLLVNATMSALKEAQEAFKGEAQKAGFESEDDLIDYLAALRREREGVQP